MRRYFERAVLGTLPLLIIGIAAIWALSPAPVAAASPVPKSPPVATREIVKRNVNGSSEELWVIRTDSDILTIPAKYVVTGDPDRGFYRLFLYWPGLDPVINSPAGRRTTRDVVEVYLYAKRPFPPRPLAEAMASRAKSYGEPRPTPDSPGMLEYAKEGEGRVRNFLAVDVSPRTWPRQPFFVMCALDLTCRSYIDDIHDARVLVDFYPEHLPNAQRLFGDVFGLLRSFYETTPVGVR